MCFNLVLSFNQRLLHAVQSCCITTHLAIVQDHDPVAVHHSIEAMGDDEGGAAAKFTTNGLLDEAICLGVGGCRCLIQYENLKRYRNNIKYRK